MFSCKLVNRLVTTVNSSWGLTNHKPESLPPHQYLESLMAGVVHDGYRTGLSIYVTEGSFRAEHRKEAEREQPVDARALHGVPIHR